MSGTPTTPGSYSITVTVYDQNFGSASQSFWVNISAPDGPGGGDDPQPPEPEPEPEPEPDPIPTPSINGIFYDRSVGDNYPWYSDYYRSYIGRLEAKGGTPPYTWSIISGDLPKGTSLACSDTSEVGEANTYVGKYADLKGIAKLGGEYNMTIRLTDSRGQSDEKDMTVKINGGDYDDVSLEAWYRWDIYETSGWGHDPCVERAKGGKTPYTWSIGAGKIPTGGTINCKDGKYDTTHNTNILAFIHDNGATMGGTFNFAYKVVDAEGRTALHERTLTFNRSGGEDPNSNPNEVIKLPSLPIISKDLKSGTVEKNYSDYIFASKGKAPYTWSISGGNLPEGFSISASDSKKENGEGMTGKYLHINGTTALKGYYNVVFKVTDKNGNTTAKSYSIKIAGEKNPLTISGDLIAEGSLYKKYSSFVKAQGGKSPYTWSVSHGELPDGIALSYSNSAKNIGEGTTGRFAHITGISTSKYAYYNITLTVTDAKGTTAAKTFTVKIGKDETPLTISCDTLPDAVVGEKYNEKIIANGGKSPFEWKLEGKLLTGLSGECKSGDTKRRYFYVKGTPTKTGKAEFTLTLKDSVGRITSKDFSFTISEDPKISISITSLANGVVGKSYNKTVSAKISGIEGKLKWTKSGTLPKGLKLTYNGNKALLSGTPTKKGTYDFTLKASYKGVEDSKSFTVTVTQTTLSGTVSNGVVKASYSKKFTASGGTKPYTWSKSGTLPNGLKLKSSNTSATLSGTPTKAGKFTFTIKVTDANNKSASKSYTVNITKPEITGSLSDGVVKAKYSGMLKVSGGTKSYTWTTSGTLPTGLTFKGSNTKAVIAGKPTKAGAFKFKVTAKDSNGASASKSFTVNVTKTTLSGTLSDGIVKTKYSGTLAASGGTEAYAWSLSGNFPNGLTFKGANTKATISGTPKTAGSYKFKVTLEDSNGSAVSKNFTIKIAASTSKASKDESSNEIDDEKISTETKYEIFDESVGNENTENDFSSSIFRTSLEVVSEDVLSKGEGKDEDIVEVKANSPVTFKLGEWVYANGTKAEISNAIVYIDDEPIEDISISDVGLFTIPAEIVKDDFKICVKAQNGKLESEELFISAIE